MSLLALALLALPCLHDQEPAAPGLVLTQELLERLEAEVLPAVNEALGTRFPDGVDVRLATTEEIEAALHEENRRIFLRQLGDEQLAERQARRFARALAPTLLAKYRLGAATILVGEDAFGLLAERLELPELLSEGTVRAVLVHELGHAASDELYGASEVLFGLDSADRIQAYNALLEGYAQHVARGICEEHGWSAGFDAYERAIGHVPELSDPETGGAGVEYFLRLQTEVFASLYRDGERFVATLAREGGPEAVARAFREPPLDSAVIFEPRWFLDPSTRPALVHDLDRGLEGLHARHPAPEWQAGRTTLTLAQLRAALSVLPADDVEHAARSVRQARVLTLTPASAPGSELVVLALFELASPAEALHFLHLERRLLETKDELMREGAIRIGTSRYEEFDEQGVEGFLSDKRILADGQELLVLSAYGVHGRLCAELLSSNVEGAVPEEAVVAVIEALQAVVAPAAAPAGATEDVPEGGAGGEEGG